jgi:hypothetical protein
MIHLSTTGLRIQPGRGSALTITTRARRSPGVGITAATVADIQAGLRRVHRPTRLSNDSPQMRSSGTPRSGEGVGNLG